MTSSTSRYIDGFALMHRYPHVQGMSIISWAELTYGPISYHEVAVLDTRSLDSTQHKWLVLESGLTRGQAEAVFVAARDAIWSHHRVYGVRWANGIAVAITRRHTEEYAA